MRTVLSLNENWTFRDTDGVKTVSLPHAWRTEARNKSSKRFYSRSISAVPNGRVLLSFESVGSVCEVFMDGIRIGGHAGGGTRFRFDVSRYVRHDCMLTVAVDAGVYDSVCPPVEEEENRGGIYGDVQLIVTGELRFSSRDYASDGIYVTPIRMEDGWYLGIKTLLDTPTPDGHIHYILKNAENETIARSERDTENPGAILYCGEVRPWDGRFDPYLYTLLAEAVTDEGIVSDTLRIPVGFRTVSFDPEKGLLLNGRAMTAHGLTYHRERTDAGFAVREEELLQDMALLLQTGADAVRLPGQNASFFLDLCDESGLLVWADMPVFPYFSSKNMENAKQRLLELIKQNYNRPSVFCWGVAREAPQGRLRQILRGTTRDLSPIAYRVDTTRATVFSCEVKKFLSERRNESAEPAALDCSAVPYFEADACVEAIHDAMPDKKIGIVSRTDCTDRDALPRREAMLQTAQAHPFLWGMFADECFDTPAVRGLADGNRESVRDAFYLYAAAWSEDDVLHICGGTERECPAGTIELKIYTDLPAVRVTAHGKIFAKTGKTVFVFPDIPVETGKNEYTVYADGITRTVTVFGV